MKHTLTVLAVLLCATLHAQAQTSAPPPAADGTPLVVGDLQLVFREGVDPAKLDALVADTRKRSKEMRAQGYKDALANSKTSLPWLAPWIIATLHEGDKAKEVNAWFRKNPRQLSGFGIKILAMFGHDGKYPGRLEADVEANLKANAWEFTTGFLDPEGGYPAGQSRYLATIGYNMKWEIFPLTWGHQWGTENQDIRHRPYVYLALVALLKDPAYSGKSIGGKTMQAWFGLMSDCMKDYLKDRVLTGLWLEPGSHYAYINFDVMIDLFETAPDPVVRQRAKMFLDLALIEDEQVSVDGQRGGNASRGGPTGSNTGKFKDIVFGDKADFLLSDYQAPAVAIVLRHAKGAVKPYHITNRVPGENPTPDPNYPRNSHLVSYAYRTQGYLIGTAHRDPNLVYHPASDQQRCSSLIFQNKMVVYPWPKEIPKTKDSGRSGKAYYSVQHDNTMVLQKLREADAVDRMEVQFTQGLTKITERAGWIFTEVGNGYAAVRFVDTAQAPREAKHTWREPPVHWSVKDKRPIRIASPEKDFLPIIIQAGDAAQFGSYEKFQKAVLASKITINAKNSELEYQSVDGVVITWNYNQDAKPLVLPKVDGKNPNLQPAMLFDSPFLKARWEDPKIYVGAGPFRAVYDMENCTIMESKELKK